MKKLLIVLAVIVGLGFYTNVFAELQVIDGPITAQSVTVSGQITIQGGSPGAGKVLTSANSTGLAAWQAASGGVGGSGTTNYIPKFTASNTIGNSIISDSGGTATVSGTARASAIDVDSGSADGGRLIWRSSGNPEWRARNLNGFLGFFRGEGSLQTLGLGHTYSYLGDSTLPTALYITGGNVGIGTTTPGTKLHVNNSADEVMRIQGAGPNYAYLSFWYGGARRGFIWADDGANGDANELLIASDNNARIRLGLGNAIVINPSSNVGIGTTSPGAKLEVNGQIKIDGGSPALNKILVSSDGYGLATWKTSGELGLQGLVSGTSGQTLRHDGTFWVANNNLYNNGTNVGIGTTAPAAKLEVNGNTLISGSINKKPTNIPLFRWLPEGTPLTVAVTGEGPNDIAFDGTNMWTANYKNNVSTVTKILPSGQTLTVDLPSSAQPNGIAFDGTNMWTANYNSTVSKIAPDLTVTTYPAGYGPMDIAFDGTNMWIASFEGDSVAKITPDGSIQQYSNIGNGPHGIAFDGTNMWTANYLGHSVTKIGPDGSVLNTYSIGAGSFPNDLAFDGTNMWVAGNSVAKITPAGTVVPILGVSGDCIAFDGTNMWVGGNTYLHKITLAGSVTNYSITGADRNGIAFDGTYMWLLKDSAQDTATKYLVVTK